MKARKLMVALVMGLAACSSPTGESADGGASGVDGAISPVDAGAGADGGAVPVDACVPKTCQELGRNCGTVRDGCGGLLDCGRCWSPETCGAGGVEGECAFCEGTESVCARLGAHCGRIETTNRCGVSVEVDCGTCEKPLSCGGGGVEHSCATPNCVPGTDEALCKEHGRLRSGVACGIMVLRDGCGNSRRVDCGGCEAPFACGALQPNLCSTKACQRPSVESLCGTQKCGTRTAKACDMEITVQCGSCGSGFQCTAGRCVCPETSESFCRRKGADCGMTLGTNLCGETVAHDCGTCTSPQTCGGGGITNVCGTPTCVPEADRDLCLRYGKNCGMFSGTDRCGKARVVMCGVCAAGNVCGAGGTANLCGCSPETDADLCARIGKNCGQVTAPDICGQTRTVACGSCAPPDTCSGGGAANVCGRPTTTCETDVEFCGRLGKNCGVVSGTDGCGKARTAHCGTCGAPDTCGGAGTPNVCGRPACTPESNPAFCARLGKDCGQVTAADNCGAPRSVSCGTCAAPKTCGGSGSANVCGCSDPEAAFCARQGKNCGQLSGVDRCGVQRTVTCGSCTAPDSCGGSGSPNVCGQPACVAETDAAFCLRNGRKCGPATGTDNCGRPRSVSNCGSCTAPTTCGGGGMAGECGCMPEGDLALCARLGKDCGQVTGLDSCGQSRTVQSCGTCSEPNTCGGSGTANACGKPSCTPESNAVFCARMGRNCGSAAGMDNCGDGRTVAECGPCTPPMTCGGAGIGGLCGQSSCTPETNSAFCARLGRVCGQVSAADNCGVGRSVSCGTCGANQVCNANGACQCDQNSIPDASGTACLAIGGGLASCPAAIRGTVGYCTNNDRTWVWCDPIVGITQMDCGFAGGCHWYSSVEGSCSCGVPGSAFPSIGWEGACARARTSDPYNLYFECVQTFLFPHNCPTVTGDPNATCGTWITAAGWTHECFCGPCQIWERPGPGCRAKCAQCTVSTGGIHICDEDL